MPRTSRSLGLIGLAAMLANPSISSGEERIEMRATPELTVYEAIFPLGHRWKQKRQRPGFNTAFSLSVGGGSDAKRRGAVGAATLALGWRAKRVLAAARSELLGFLPEQGEGIELAELRGHHRVVGIVDVAADKPRKWSLRFGLDGWARHSGEQSFRLDAVRFSSAPMTVGGLDLAVHLRNGDPEVWADFPIHYKVEQTQWKQGALASTRSQSMTMGVGVAPAEDFARGVVRVLAATVEHTRFERRPGAEVGAASSAAIADEVRRVTLASDLDKLTVTNRNVTGVMSYRFGWSWLQSDIGGDNTRAHGPDFQLGLNFRFGDPGQRSQLGLGVETTPTRSAGGGILIQESRLELSAGYDHDSVVIDARGGLGVLKHKAGGDYERTPSVVRYGTHLEAFYKLPLNFQVGAYVATSFEPQRALDPWAVSRTWNSEGGLLLRWKRYASEKVRRSYPPRKNPHGSRRPVTIQAR